MGPRPASRLGAWGSAAREPGPAGADVLPKRFGGSRTSLLATRAWPGKRGRFHAPARLAGGESRSASTIDGRRDQPEPNRGATHRLWLSIPRPLTFQWPERSNQQGEWQAEEVFFLFLMADGGSYGVDAADSPLESCLDGKAPFPAEMPQAFTTRLRLRWRAQRARSRGAQIQCGTGWWKEPAAKAHFDFKPA